MQADAEEVAPVPEINGVCLFVLKIAAPRPVTTLRSNVIAVAYVA